MKKFIVPIVCILALLALLILGGKFETQAWFGSSCEKDIDLERGLSYDQIQSYKDKCKDDIGGFQKDNDDLHTQFKANSAQADDRRGKMISLCKLQKAQSTDGIVPEDCEDYIEASNIAEGKAPAPEQEQKLNQESPLNKLINNQVDGTEL